MTGEELTKIEPLPGNLQSGYCIVVWKPDVRWVMAYIRSTGRTATDRWHDLTRYPLNME